MSQTTSIPAESGTEPVPDEVNSSDSTVNPAGSVPSRTGLRRVFLGPDDDPAWARPLLWVLLVGTGVLYLVDLTASEYANDFYAAAVKSGTESWKAWLFGSLDSSSAITVDKPPAAMWIMGLSGRIFGFSSASMLVPEALMGVGSVALLHATVKRWSGPAAGLVAGAILALTPVAALMFRFNNPDALLVLLMTAGAYCVLRATQGSASKSRFRPLTWLVFAGTAIGFAFLTKMLQGLLVLPGFGLVYLISAPPKLWTRIWHLLVAAAAVMVSAGWFVVLVALWPADSRPYIGGSTDNSLWELAIDYNGLGRIFGESRGGGGGFGGGGGGGGSQFGGTTGLDRLFGSAFGTQISWLLPAALIGLVGGLWFTRKSRRTDGVRAGVILWGGWLLATAIVFSYMQGIVHPYYSVALAPAIAALVAIGGREMWHAGVRAGGRVVLAVMIAATAGWSSHLLHTDAPNWHPWLAPTVLTAGLVGAVMLAVPVPRVPTVAAVGLVIGSLAAAGGATAFTAQTVSTAHTGSTPTAGPASASGFGGRGGFGGFGGGGFPGGGGVPGGGQGGPGGGQGGTSASGNLVTLLENTTNRWAAATIGSQSADGYILSTDKAVMAIGGFSGSDPSPTLTQFQQYVADKQIGYFVAGGFGGRGGGGSSSDISSWVQAHFTATTVGGATVYDLRVSPSA